MVCAPGGLVVREREGKPAPLDDQDASALGVATGALYIGRLDDADVLAASIDAAPPAPFSVAGLRTLFEPFGDGLFLVAGRAVQLIEWAETSRFCGRCASPTVRTPAEFSVRCSACHLSVYPRIAPAVIALVRRGDEALLARGSRFPRPFFSTLAGFSEPGESLEDTLRREIREEVGVEIENPRYFGSQPWPFPHSLMVGFTADWASGEIRIDHEEILDARWFRADDLPMIPPKLSIARRLIDAWVTEVLGGSPG